MLTKAFWLGAADRSVKSFAQALLLLWGSDEVFNILEIDVVPALGVGAGAAALSLLTSIVSAPAGDKGSSALLPGAK
ncbi:holin [Pseudonocardia zijingensis]